MLKKLIFISLLSLNFACSNFNINETPLRTPAQESNDEKIGVAIIDGPIDYKHPNIINILDSDLMESVSLIDTDGTEKTWAQINEETKKAFEDKLNKGRYQFHLEFIDLVSRSQDKSLFSEDAYQPKEKLKKMMKGLFLYIFSSNFRKQLNLVSNYIHGTHVAGIAVSGLDNIRLVNIPLMNSPKKSSISEIFKFNIEEEKTILRRHMQNISNLLDEGNIRIVNMSMASSEDIVYRHLKSNTGILTKIFLNKRIKRAAKEMSLLQKMEFSNLFDKHPNTIFVLAAGNDGVDITNNISHTANINKANVVKVTAINRQGLIADFSNTSNSSVDIAALGVSVKSSLIEGGEISLSGSSQAAPKVTNELLKIIKSEPSISPEQTIEKLYSINSMKFSHYTEDIKNGQIILDNSFNKYIDSNSYFKRFNLEKDYEEAQISQITNQVYKEMNENDQKFGILEFFSNGKLVKSNEVSIDNGKITITSHKAKKNFLNISSSCTERIEIILK